MSNPQQRLPKRWNNMRVWLVGILHLANEHTHATWGAAGLDILFSAKEGCHQTCKSIQGMEGTITKSMHINPTKLKLH